MVLRPSRRSSSRTRRSSSWTQLAARRHLSTQTTRFSRMSSSQLRVRHSRTSATLPWELRRGTESLQRGVIGLEQVEPRHSCSTHSRCRRAAHTNGESLQRYTERRGSGTRSRTGRFVLAGSGGDASEYAHSLYSTTEGAHRAGSRLRTIARRSVIGRLGKIEAIED
jgi:hypothetical protein